MGPITRAGEFRPFISGHIANRKVVGNGGDHDFSLEGEQVYIGGLYQASNNLALGGAVSFDDSKGVIGRRANFSAEHLSVHGFSRYAWKGVFLDAAMSYGEIDFDDFSRLAGPVQNVTAETMGHHWNASFGLSGKFDLGESWVRPRIGYSHSEVIIDSFDETGEFGAGLSLAYGDQSTESRQLIAALDALLFTIELDKDLVLDLHSHGAYRHELTNARSTITSQLIDNVMLPVITRGAKRFNESGEVGVAMGLTFRDRFTLQLGVDYEMGHEFKNRGAFFAKASARF